MGRIDIEDILDRYLQGTASPDEIGRVDTWLNQRNAPAAQWKQMDKTSRDQWLSGLFSQVQDSAGINSAKVVKMQPQRGWWVTVAAVAAMVAIVFGVYINWPAIQNNINPVQLTVLNVPANQKKQVVLADGSIIRINSLSQIKYPKVFNRKTREVYLSGEAYFDIKHDATRPFIIHTGKVATTVLGTAFNIKEDKLLHTIVVTVTRGKVSVANGKRQIGVITPNQQISFNVLSNKVIQAAVDTKQVIAWEGDIHFDDIAFADAAAQLQDRFKVKISFTNEKVKACRFTGTALKADKLDDILKVICALNNATYQTKPDGSILIDGAGCN